MEARKASDFSQFAPFLQQWVDISKQRAAAIDPTKPPYDVLLEDFEKGMTTTRLDAIFTEVRVPAQLDYDDCNTYYCCVVYEPGSLSTRSGMLKLSAACSDCSVSTIQQLV